MQKLFQGLDLVFAKGGFDRMRTIGFGFQHFQSMGVELFDHIPHRLIIAIRAQFGSPSACAHWLR